MHVNGMSVSFDSIMPKRSQNEAAQPAAKKTKTLLEHVGRSALEAYRQELSSYMFHGGGTINRMCMEDNRFLAFHLAPLAGLDHELKRIETAYERATKGRTWLCISGNTPDAVAVNIEGHEIKTQPDNAKTIERFVDRCRRELEAQTDGVPAKNESTDKWMKDKWQFAAHWMTLHEKDGYFEVQRKLREILELWPYDNVESLEVFKCLVSRYGIPYSCKAFPKIRANRPFFMVLVDLRKTLAENDLRSNIKPEVPDDLDELGLLVSPEQLLLIVLKLDKKSMVEAWIQRFHKNSAFDEDAVKSFIFRVKDQHLNYDSEHIRILIKLGYLPEVPKDPKEDHFFFFRHYLRKWGIPI